MAGSTITVSLDEVIHYHLKQIRIYGAGWRAPQVRQHRERIIALIRLRRHVRRTYRDTNLV